MLSDTRRSSEGFCRARATLRGYGKNRSEGGVGGGKKISTAGTAIVGGDGGSCTSDESPRRSRDVVNPHTWPVRVKIAKIRGGERESTQNSMLGVGYQPAQTNTGGEAARFSAVVFRGRLWQTGQEIGISVGAALAVLEGVIERGEKLEQPLDSSNVISHFAHAFERLVIREDAKLRALEAASKAFDESLWGTSVKERHVTVGREDVGSTVNCNLRGKRGVVESIDTVDETGAMFW